MTLLVISMIWWECITKCLICRRLSLKCFNQMFFYLFWIIIALLNGTKSKLCIIIQTGITVKRSRIHRLRIVRVIDNDKHFKGTTNFVKMNEEP